MTGHDPGPVTGIPGAGPVPRARRLPGLPGRVTPHGLARRSVGAPVLWLLGVSASAPMTTVAGGVIATYASTGVVAVPLSYLLLAAALWLFAVGYTRRSAALPHAATFAALLTHGLGRTVGAGGAAVALLAYNAVQLALYGLLGATAAGRFGGPWWAWALLAWAVVAVIGMRGLNLGAPVITAVLACELTMIVVVDVVGLTHPAHTDAGSWWAPWRPDLLATAGVGGLIAFGVAGFLGFETTAAYAEEARTPSSVPRATTASLVFLGIFYAISAWVPAVAVGPDRIAAVAADPGSGIPFSLLATHLGPLGPDAAAAGIALLVMSVLGAMIALHQVVARYLYALGREHVLPARLATISTPPGADAATRTPTPATAMMAVDGGPDAQACPPPPR